MTDQVAIVTGASSGIGAATARRLQGLGYIVYAVARRLDLMAPLSQIGIRPVRVDVTDDAALTAFVSHVIEETGRIDVLVNNAGYGCLGAVEDVPMTEARRELDVNLFGLARLTQLVLPHMRGQRSGRIINVSSIGGKLHTPLGGWYHAAKFAVEGLSDALRLELAPFGIQVVVVEPGATNTEWHRLAADRLLRSSVDSAYADQVTEVVRALSAADLASRPEVIANAIVRAVRARRPRTRYAAGIGAKPIILARRVLPDRVFDGLIRLSFRIVSGTVRTRQAVTVSAGRSS
jgi:NAD(P)-dependent dehydrogenase (short-subunit alcohol dehydrogenase family)